MKSEISAPQPAAFRPFTLTITLETLEEAQVIRRIYGLCGLVSDVLREDDTGISVSKMERKSVTKILKTAFEPMEQYFEVAGLQK